MRSISAASRSNSTNNPVAMQFAPATEDTSWDAIAATTNEQEFASRPAPAASTIVSGTSSSNNYVRRSSFRSRRAAKAAAAAASTNSEQKSTISSSFSPQQPPKANNTSSNHNATATKSSASMPASGGGNRIARLASLFSSRATVDQDAQNQSSNHESSSNGGSSSGAGYVAWPGTQDRKGSTVVVHSSYEESDTPPVPTLSEYERNVQRAVDREVDNWMNSDDAISMSSSTPSSTPQRKPFTTPQHHSYSATTTNHRSKPKIVDSTPRSTSRVVTPEQQQHLRYQNPYFTEEMKQAHDYQAQPIVLPGGDVDDSFSSDGAASDTSSAYFTPNQFQTIRAGGKINHVHGNNKSAAAAVMRRKQQQQPPQQVTKLQKPAAAPVVVQPLSETALRARDQQQPPHKTPANSLGFAGLLHKTQDMPNLMDDEVSETSASQYSSASYRQQQYNTSTSRRIMSSRHTVLATNPEDDVLDDVTSDIFESLNAVPYRAASLDPPDTNSVSESDVFEDVDSSDHSSYNNNAPQHNNSDDGPYVLRGAAPRDANQEGEFSVVMLGGGLTTIQTTLDHFSNRITPYDYDDNLSTSDVDQDGYAKIPGFHQMVSAGKRGDGSLAGIQGSVAPHNQKRPPAHVSGNINRNDNNHGVIYRTHTDPQSKAKAHHNGSDSGASSLFPDPYKQESWGHNVNYSLSQYYVHPDEMKLIVRKFRKLSQMCSTDLSYDDLQRQEDATRAFALSEMRSRIMEKDIERGLERRGGTKAVDDIVLTPYNREAMRIRDAVIVSKAWRDGSTPRDVINTALLTQQPEKTYSIKRPHWFFGMDNTQHKHKKPYRWQKVTWIDDMEFSRYRCLSLGSRAMRGYEMFTIGDCQSILLKLTNERCMELREALNVATANQIEAEDMMRVESQYSDGMVKEAEMIYLTAVEEVKKISHELVVAEKSFTLVRDRIEKLVAKYEALLVKFENEASSAVGSSVITYESSSYYSDDYSSTDEEERERKTLERRAQRAELRAELAAREALLAKEEARLAREEKENELNALKLKLLELQSEASNAISEREHSVILARAITANKNHGSPPLPPNKGGANRISKSKIDDVKKRFRDRTAAKKLNNSTETASTYASTNQSYRSNASPEKDQAARERSNLFRTLGEEMFQNLDFYERSLKAVEGTTTGLA